jgi:RND superfamily putative drug exporter
LNFDLRKFSAQDVRQAEARVLPVTFVLLLLAFGSLVAAMLPVGVGVLAISMTLGAAALLTHEMQLSILVHNLATMIGLGLGIDYALLMVSRFREALAAGHDAGNAADIAAALAGRTLAISASTVAIGFSALLMVPISEIRSIGVSGLLVTAMSVVLSILVLPFVLGLLGERINAGRIRIPLRWSKSANHPAASRRDRWRRWGMAVTNRPWTALLIAGLPLLLLTYQSRRLTTGLPAGDWLPPAAESVHAVHSLEAMGRAGIVQSLRVVVELPPDSPPASAAGWRAISRMTRILAADPRAQKVVSLPTLLEMAESPADLAQLPEDSRASFLRRDGRATLIEIFPSITESPNDQIRWVLELRKADPTAMTGLAGTKLGVGGIAALNADYQEMVQKFLPGVMGAVVSGSLFALLVGLRSLLAAVKAVVLNLLSVGASFGALVLVFQEGHGSEWFGVVGGTGRVYPLIPILSFAIVFGLSMDYEVFLVARVLEERRRGLSEQAAVAEGLAGTAGLITSAAAIMIAAFAAFTLGSFLVIKMLGFTLAVAVLIDATIVRMVIGPALLQLAGDWNWWPRGLDGSKPMPVPEAGL